MIKISVRRLKRTMQDSKVKISDGRTRRQTLYIQNLDVLTPQVLRRKWRSH